MSDISREIFKTLIAVLILFLGVAVFWTLIRQDKSEPRHVDPPGPPQVEVVVAQEHTGALEIEVDGTVVPFREITVSAEVAGRIAFKADGCQAGKYVETGQLLLRIDPLEYQLEERQLTKELEQSVATIRELTVEIENVEELISLAREDADLQRKELARNEALGKTGVITDSQVDQEKRDMLASTNRLMTLINQQRLLNTSSDRLKAAHGFVQANLEKAQLNLQRTELKSRVTGMIVSDDVEEGSFVQRGQNLYTIEDTSAVEVKCTLRMDQLYWLLNSPADVAPGSAESAARDYQLPPTAATVVYELEGREYFWQGILTRYDGIGLDERTRTVPCRILVDKPRVVHSSDDNAALTGPKALVRGMYVSVILHVQPETSLITMPESAIKPGNLIWTVVENQLSIERVHIVRVQHGKAFIIAEPGTLTAGAQIVTTPIAGDYDGMPVEVVPSDLRKTAPDQT
ncbi:MAG: hypothetical protein CMJ81_15380 [Planctomycetaceae bacterium]|nr:hypothetical protein [Planctomycetaceae bacterium]MBP62777.1 hypothetical protein [Planctomycetaceae bacterium]